VGEGFSLPDPIAIQSRAYEGSLACYGTWIWLQLLLVLPQDVTLSNQTWAEWPLQGSVTAQRVKYSMAIEQSVTRFPSVTPFTEQPTLHV